MTYFEDDLGIVNSTVRKKLLLDNNKMYVGLLYTKQKSGDKHLIYKGFKVKPFIISDGKFKLVVGYTAVDVETEEFNDLVKNLESVRTLGCVA